jgi:hypothetical protein
LILLMLARAGRHRDRTAPPGSTFDQDMSSPFEVLFTLTLYRDGQIRIDGHGRKDRMPEILRMIASLLDAGAPGRRNSRSGGSAPAATTPDSWDRRSSANQQAGVGKLDAH